MTTVASQITSLTVVYSIVYSGADQRKHQSSVSLAFVRGIHRDPWIPRTKSQKHRKWFHLMTSSCIYLFMIYVSLYLFSWYVMCVTAFNVKRVGVRGPRGIFQSQPEYQIFTKMTPKERLNIKISQILPKESSSKRKNYTQHEYFWHLNTQRGV